MAKWSLPRALETKPEVEIWRRPDLLNRRPRLPIRPRDRHSDVFIRVSISHRYGVLAS